MLIKSETITMVNIDFSPGIFLSHGNRCCFSLSGSDLPLKTTATECTSIGIDSTLSIYNSPPTQGQNRDQALYDFSIRVSGIPEVKAVTFQVERNVVRIWTFIPRVANTFRKSIYEKELELMDKYPEMIFDFNLVTLDDFSHPFIPQDLHGYLVYYNNLNG